MQAIHYVATQLLTQIDGLTFTGAAIYVARMWLLNR